MATLDPLIVKAMSVGLGLMFVIAARHKFVDGPTFRATVADYQILPAILLPGAARIIPAIELILGVSLLLSMFAQTLTAIAAAGLLGIYALAIALNLARGRIHIDCGCGFGGTSDGDQLITGGLVVRNLVLAALSLLTLLPTGSRVLGGGDYLTLLATLAAGTLLFVASNKLISNRALINTWRKPRD